MIFVFWHEGSKAQSGLWFDFNLRNNFEESRSLSFPYPKQAGTTKRNLFILPRKKDPSSVGVTRKSRCYSQVINGYFPHVPSLLCGNFSASYLTKAAATPPSTFRILPVDLPRRPPTKAKTPLAISLVEMISFKSVRLA